MAFQTILSVSAYFQPFTLIIEPWAKEFAINIGDKCEVVGLHPLAPPTFGAEVCRGCDLMVWIKESGATYEFWRGGSLEFDETLAIPG